MSNEPHKLAEKDSISLSATNIRRLTCGYGILAVPYSSKVMKRVRFSLPAQERRNMISLNLTPMTLKPALTVVCENCGRDFDWYIVPTGSMNNFACPHCFKCALIIKIEDKGEGNDSELHMQT